MKNSIALWLSVIISFVPIAWGHSNTLPPLPGTASFQGDNLSPVVQELKVYFDSDSTAKAQLKKDTQSAISQGCWNSTAPEYLYEFLESMLNTPPIGPNADYKTKSCFFNIIADSETSAFSRPELQAWLIRYIQSIRNFMLSRESTSTIVSWIHSPKVKINDFIVPLGGYKSFNDFFTRRLKENVRPISAKNDSSIIVSPNDGNIKILLNELEHNSVISIKNDPINAFEIFEHDELARHFIGGPVLYTTLSDHSYHHFHTPVTGTVAHAQLTTGKIGGGHDGLGTWPEDAWHHQRGTYIFDTPDFGYVGMAAFGFWYISDVVMDYNVGDNVEKGNEVGHFAFGGSAILLFFEPDAIAIDRKFSFPQPSDVQMGQRIGQALKTKKT